MLLVTFLVHLVKLLLLCRCAGMLGELLGFLGQSSLFDLVYILANLVNDVRRRRDVLSSTCGDFINEDGGFAPADTYHSFLRGANLICDLCGILPLED